MREKTYSFTIEEIPIIVTKKRMKICICVSVKRMEVCDFGAASDERRADLPFCKGADRLDPGLQGKISACERGTQGIRQLSEAELKQQKLLLKRDVEKLIAKWEPVMGVKASGVTIRQMKTRWGSCNVRTHHININLALAKKPPECLEYVVVHELTHILEPSHNAVFWGYMTQFYPNWKRVRKYLNDEVPE